MLNTLIIGNKITEARKKNDLSQSQLAELLSVSPQAVSKWERGESMPDLITFDRMAEILSVDLNYFSDNFESSTPEKEPNKGWNMSSGTWKDADFSGLSNLNDRLSSSNIINCLLIGSDLSGITLRSNNITDSDFTNSSLSDCKMSSMNIKRDKFDASNMKNAVIKSCNITESSFQNTILTGALFKSCNMKSK